MAKRTLTSWPIVVGLVLGVLACFAPTLGNDFVDWDDDLVLTDNLAYRGLSPSHLRWMLTTTLGGHYQPLTWLSFAVDHALFGMDARGYHLTNLLLHTANAVLVWLVLRTLLRSMTLASEQAIHGAAAIGALLFAIHPLRVESVAWATERRDVLSGAFWLLALLAYLRAVTAAPTARARGLGCALAALVASLGAKAWGMTFPIVLLILDAYPLRRLQRDPSAVLREKIPFVLVSATGAIVAFLAQQRVPDMRTLGEHGVGARVAQAAYGLCFYLAESLYPVGLHPAYLLEPHLDPMRGRYVAAMVAVAAVTAAATALRRRCPWFLAAWGTYAVILAPVLGLAQTGPQLVADRYTYLACLPWTALVAAGLARLWSRAEPPWLARTVTALSLVALLALGTMTSRQTAVWRDSLTLWNHTLALDPENWIAFTNRGFAQLDHTAAIADYTEAIRVNPRYYLAYFNRGNARHDQRDTSGAIADYTAAITLLPADPQAYNNRGWARQGIDDWAGAISDYERALDLAPTDWWARPMVTGNLAAARARLTANPR